METNIKIIKREYSILGGWDETSWYVDPSHALKLAANCQRGNANLSESPEDWAKEMIDKKVDFSCFPSTETCYSFIFENNKL